MISLNVLNFAGSNFTTTHVTVDVDKRVMTAFVRLVYTGTADIGTSREREALFALKEALGVKGSIASEIRAIPIIDEEDDDEIQMVDQEDDIIEEDGDDDDLQVC